jgi:peroxiredoxin
MPTMFLDSRGNSVELKRYLGKSVVLVVVRGLPESPGGVFCPYCLAQANSLSKNYSEFTGRNAEVLLVVPGSQGVTTAFLQQVQGGGSATVELPFPLCLDENAIAANQMGIRGDLAKPSTFILDREGKIVYAYVGKSTSDRPSVKAVLAELDRLRS